MDWSDYAFSLRTTAFGESPAIFYLEVVIRTTLLYAFALILVRVLGKRGMGQLTPYEFVVLIAMGSALGDPMFYPDVALLPPMLVLLTITALHRTVSVATQKNKIAETFVEGKASVLMRDGRVVEAALKSEVVSFDELAMLLRQQGIENLAAVRFAALEPSGNLSVFMYEDKSGIGLPLEALLPESGVERFCQNAVVARNGFYSCLGCGTTLEFSAGVCFDACPSGCGDDWVAARSVTPNHTFQ